MDQPNPTLPTGPTGVVTGRTEQKSEGQQQAGTVPTHGRFPLLDRVSCPADLRNLSV
ncbi:hypothetical protein HLH34_17895, partial [Gluconacetobacter azotocaptans]|nr:hypothetical protein [Gluconacetobacter azotocaptans]